LQLALGCGGGAVFWLNVALYGYLKVLV
jgi:hypothetical protein